MSAFDFTPEQKQAIFDRGGPLLVSAGAGSGKTRVLVERLLARVCDEGVNIDDFLVITYTKAAAAELRGRILEAISQRLAQKPGDRHLRRQSTLIYRAKISTVHAFCSGIIRQNAHLLGISPDFRALDEKDSALLQSQVLDDVLESFYDALGNDPDFAALADAASSGRDDKRLCRIALDLHKAIQSHTDPEAWLDRAEQAYVQEPDDPGETPWGRFLLDRARAQAAHYCSELSDALQLLSRSEKLEKAYAECFETALSGLTALSRALEEGFFAAARVEVQFPRLNGVRNCDDPFAQAQAQAAWNRCKEGVKKFSGLLCDPEALLSDLRAVRGQVKALFRLVRAFSQAYAAEKRRRGLVDFSDQEHLALRLLREGEGPSPLAAALSARFTEVCVDEYQDSSRVQELIYKSVSDEGQKLFMVGDVKQSIYRFRLADPTLFLEKFLSWKEAEAALPGEPRRVSLSRNFRSAPALLDAVNYVFYNIMSTQAGELDYTEAVFLRPGLPAPAAEEPATEFYLLDCRTAGDEGPDRPLAEAAFIAQRAKALHAQGIPYRDMVILMRAPGARLAPYSQAFAQAGVPLAAESAAAFWTQVEMQVILSFLSVIDNPHQDIPLISVLRSPLFGFKPDDLARIRLADKRADFFSALRSAADGGDGSAQNFLCQLDSLREAAADLPADALLRRIYSETALPAVFGAMPEGRQRQANLMLLLDYAHSYEAAGFKGLFSFLNHLQALIEEGLAPQGAALPADSAAVRIMSIHKSKGLEFPVVFLADTAHRFNQDDARRPLLIHPDLGVGPKRTDPELGASFETLPRMAISAKLLEEQLAEEMRLLYVAMTRARDRLIITALPQSLKQLPARLLNGYSLPPSPFRVQDARSMSDWLIPLAAARPEGSALRELADSMESDAVGGAPWLIRHVLVEDPTLAEAQPAAAAESSAPAAPLPDIADLMRLSYAHQAAVALPSKLTATTLKGRFTDFEAAANSPVKAPRNAFRRPVFLSERPLSPTERGTALHLAMQFLDFRACTVPGGVEQELARLLAQRYISPAQYAAIQPEKIARFFASPLGQRLMAAENMTREFKFSLLVDAGDYFPEASGEKVLLQGVVDCAFEEDGKLTIIDFKTDYVTPSSQQERAEHYRIQLETYSKALSRITGLPIGQRFLYFFATGAAIQL